MTCKVLGLYYVFTMCTTAFPGYIENVSLEFPLINPLAQSVAFNVNLYMNGTFKLAGLYYFLYLIL